MQDIQRQELAAFLRARREGLQPDQADLPLSKRRRTPGLRREEVAYLANVSASWYTSLEQGREMNPSQQLLESVAQALQLTPDERMHLFLLAGMGNGAFSLTLSQEEPPPLLQNIVNDLSPKPAYIMDYRWRYLASNAAAEAVFAISKGVSSYPDNILWQLFADPALRTFFFDWSFLAQKVTALFRAEYAHFLEDPYLNQLVADLLNTSPEFRTWWPRHDVCQTFECHKELRHPLAGEMLFEHLTLQIPSVPGLKLMVYVPCSKYDSEQKLKKLLSAASSL